MKMLEREKAYIAGVIDCDGSIYIARKPKGASNLVLDVTQSDKGEGLLEWLYEKIGGQWNTRRTRAAYWRIFGWKAQELLEAVYPYMIVKEERAALALSFPVGDYGTRFTEDERELREMIYEKMKELNAK